MPKLMNKLTDNFFYDEMLTHPALFLHRKPKNIVTINLTSSALSEILKHPTIEHLYAINSSKDLDDPRLSYITENWLKECAPATIDIVIIDQTTNLNYPLYSHLLNDDGILVQPCPSSIYDLAQIKDDLKQIEQNGFRNLQLLNFHQPSYQNGWRSLVLVSKHAKLRRIREKDLYNRTFTTKFYNLDTHKAAMALPEFLREELEM